MAMTSFRFEFFSYCRPQLRALQRVHVTAVGLWFASDLTFSVCAAACVGFVSWLLDYKSMLAPSIDLFFCFFLELPYDTQHQVWPSYACAERQLS